MNRDIIQYFMSGVPSDRRNFVISLSVETIVYSAEGIRGRGLWQVYQDCCQTTQPPRTIFPVISNQHIIFTCNQNYPPKITVGNPFCFRHGHDWLIFPPHGTDKPFPFLYINKSIRKYVRSIYKFFVKKIPVSHSKVSFPVEFISIVY